jgi:uncharacterized protein
LTHFIYLHGFNSAFDPNHEKVRHLETIGYVTGITYDTTAKYSKIFDDLTEHVRQYDLTDVVFVGTSLGAFWAAKMSQYFGTPSVLINPCYDPTSMLQKYVGEQTNYQTGVKTNFTVDSCESYVGTVLQGLQFNYKPLMIVDLGDEVIDSNKTIELLSTKMSETVQWNGGSHRFDHMEQSLDYIRSYVNRCSILV